MMNNSSKTSKKAQFNMPQNQDQQNNINHSYAPRRSSDQDRNTTMNRSAVLTDKSALRLSKQIPLYISTKSHKNSIKNQTQIAGISLASSNIRASKKDLITDKKQRKSNKIDKTKFPKQIIDILYRQGLKNYNPYIVVLNMLGKYDEQSLSYAHRQYIKKLCFIGLAKKYLRNKKFAITPKYSRTGVLIRTYMNDIISQKLKIKRQQQQITIIECNPTALSFNPYHRPPQLQEQITKRKYSQTIRSVNAIITNQYKKYKLSNCSFLNNSPTYFQIAMYILVTLMVFLLFIINPENGTDAQLGGIIAVFVLIFIGMIGSWIQCDRNVNKIQQSKSMIDNTCKKIQNYFQSINNDSMIWKIGQDFYWIEIHNIKVHRRKYQANFDDF